MNLSLLINVLGGIGLILLGMKLMTGGLRQAAGAMLKDMLAKWTKTPRRGLFTGFFITSLVQSSSAVSVATIGFVNAGFMTLAATVWVVYGSNIGTTTTAWIVAFLGLKVNIKALAMPFIGLGMFLLLTGKESRRAHMGEALAGFGLFFLGIEAMEAAFSGLSAGVPIETLAGYGVWGIVGFVGIGFLLTFLMQSSSGAMALILTAVASGMVPLNMAAAAVIGANVGTTSTAALAAIGATSNAKRVATAHIVFNLITGIVALALLPAMLSGILWIRNKLNLAPDPASILAVFHTVFNILGVALLWKFTPRLVAFLETRFRTMEEDESNPRFLDDTVAETSSLALSAMLQEIGRIGDLAIRTARTSLMCSKRPCRELKTISSIVAKLMEALALFAVKVRRSDLSQETSEAFPNVLRTAQYYNVVAEMAVEADRELQSVGYVGGKSFLESRQTLLYAAVAVMDKADTTAEAFTPEEMVKARDIFEQRYQSFKANVLEQGASGELTVEQMGFLLDGFSRFRHMVNQAVKGSHLLHDLKDRLNPKVDQAPLPLDTEELSAGGKREGEPLPE